MASVSCEPEIWITDYCLELQGCSAKCILYILLQVFLQSSSHHWPPTLTSEGASVANIVLGYLVSWSKHTLAAKHVKKKKKKVQNLTFTDFYWLSLKVLLNRTGSKAQVGQTSICLSTLFWLASVGTIWDHPFHFKATWPHKTAP